MDDAYETWQQSAHHTNASGVKVTCVSCHLPPREQYASHLTAKAHTGIKDAWVHYFGEYDKDASRKHVLETIPDKRCLSCHSNLLAMPSSGPVKTVHEGSLWGSSDNDGCVDCHDNLHGPKEAEPEPKQYEEAENYYCYVCHLNFQDEELATTHKNANVGCVDCHGDSDKHSADEDHATPPDVMFKKSDINEACMVAECHPEAQLKEEIGHRPYFSVAGDSRQYCTICHGEHMIPERHRKWDKDTGKLIWKDGYEVK